MPKPRLTQEVISAAIDGYEAQKSRIDDKIAALRALLPGHAPETATAPEPLKRKRRKMSAAGRARIAEAQRKRWAKLKRQPGAGTSAAPKKRKLSAAGRKAIIAAIKKRWAANRAAAQ